jgi:hypothetical protein
VPPPGWSNDDHTDNSCQGCIHRCRSQAGDASGEAWSAWRGPTARMSSSRERNAQPAVTLRRTISSITDSARLQSNAIIFSYICCIISSINLSSSLIAHRQRRKTCSRVSPDWRTLLKIVFRPSGFIWVTASFLSVSQSFTLPFGRHRLPLRSGAYMMAAQASVPCVTAHCVAARCVAAHCVTAH